MTKEEIKIYLEGYADGARELSRRTQKLFYQCETAADTEGQKPENESAADFYMGLSYAFEQSRDLIIAEEQLVVKAKYYEGIMKI